MSSILKALKKLDEEKPRKETPSGVDENDRQAPGVRSASVPLLAGVVVGGVIVALIFLLRDGDPPVNQQSSIDAGKSSSTVVAVQSAEDPGGFEPVAKAVTGETPAEAESRAALDEFLPVVQKKNTGLVAIQPNAPKTVDPALPVKAETPPEQRSPPVDPVTETSSNELTGPSKDADAEDKNAADSVVQEGVTGVRMKTATIPRPGYEKVGDSPAIPDLPFLVSDIFYVEGDSANMAVVNDLPVMEGTLIDGALLREIHPGHVVFEVDGTEVQIPLTQGQNENSHPSSPTSSHR